MKLGSLMAIQVNVVSMAFFLFNGVISFHDDILLFRSSFKFENIKRIEFEKWKMMLFEYDCRWCYCFWNVRHSIEIRKYLHDSVILIVFPLLLLLFLFVLLLMYNVHRHTRVQGIATLRGFASFCFNILKSEDKFNTSREETN